MKSGTFPKSTEILEKERKIPFIFENRKIILQFIFTILFISLGIWFLRHEKAELIEVKGVLINAKANWVAIGISLTVVYVLLMGLMYVFAFRSIQCKVKLSETSILFLKRNFISVFLPAGGVSSLAFFAGNIESRGITKTQVHFASSIYGFVSIFSVVIVAIPAFLYAVTQGASSSSDWYALLTIIIILGLIITIYYSIKKKGKIYNRLVKISPSLEVFLDDLQNHTIQMQYFYYTLLCSIIVEIVGIVHVYIAMIALGIEPSVFAATMGYLIAVIFLLVSPFLRGLGAIEVSMALIFTNFGFSSIESIAITFLFRFFEFWLPILAGIISFLNKANKYLMRMIPAILLFFMGVINILSFLTPALKDRLEWLERILILDVINASNIFVLVAGIFLLVTAAFLLKGLRNAWWFAIVLLSISFVAHLTKNVDYEDAFIALVIMLVLIFSRKQYYIKSNTHFRDIGLKTALYCIAAVLIYGVIGFYSLDIKHFGRDFTLLESIKYSIENYFLLVSSSLIPVDAFARHYLVSIHTSSIITFSFLIYILVRPLVSHKYQNTKELEAARKIVLHHGKSAIDYFKIQSDKNIFIPENSDSFLAYRMNSNYAIVLENPVAIDNNQIERCIKEFDTFCYENSLKSVFFRVPEESLEIYSKVGKKSMYIGQEACVDLIKFNLSDSKYSGLKAIHDNYLSNGYKSILLEPPVDIETIKNLKKISEEWFRFHPHSELTFMHGQFKEVELKNQSILAVQNSKNQTVAFANLINAYSDEIPSYDLLQYSANTPGEISDFIIIEFLLQLKNKGVKKFNLGYAPGLESDVLENYNKRSHQFAYEKIRSLPYFKDLRYVKEKFSPEWKNCYLVYENSYDLLEIPNALKRVFKPV